MSLTFHVTDRATAGLTALQGRLTGRRLSESIGTEVSNEVKRNFRRLPSNQRGFPSTGFWKKAAKPTFYTVQDDGSSLVTISQIGIRQRFQGGVITPVHAKALAIPVSPAAYGKTPADFPDLFIVKLKAAGGDGKGKAFLARKSSDPAKPEFLFQLLAKVEQQPHPETLPAPEAIQSAIKRAVKAALK